MPVDGVGSTTPGPTPPAAQPEAVRIRQMAQEFEAMMLSQMLGSMRQAAGAGKGSPGGKGQNIYQQMMDDEMGRTLAKGGGLGLTDALVRDLVRQAAIQKKPSSPRPEKPISLTSGAVQVDRPDGGLQ
jgi:peptidoglycan hydrolase FlgJ